MVVCCVAVMRRTVLYTVPYRLVLYYGGVVRYGGGQYGKEYDTGPCHIHVVPCPSIPRLMHVQITTGRQYGTEGVRTAANTVHEMGGRSHDRYH